MRELPGAQDYRFHELFTHADVKAGPAIPVQKLHDGALEQLHAFEGSIDAIVGYWDFPVSTLLPLLCRTFGLPSPSFEATLKCEHKFWSRLEQQQVIPDFIPPFCAVDPFADNPRSQITLDYPFWIKPVKAASSHLAFRVDGDSSLEHALKRIRASIYRFAEPFNYLLDFAELPASVASVDGHHCIAEGVISRGRQCTLEGYVYQGEVQVYGAVDSIRQGRHRSSFARYQYPSRIPRRVQQRMHAITDRFLTHIGFDNGPFNIEFYWDNQCDRLWLLEINTRISKSHCPLFRAVDGASHHKVMLDLSLGQRPAFPHRQGTWPCAAKFMWRLYEDAMVKRIPSAAEIEAIRTRFPGTEIQLHIQPGMRLSELRDQDSYSYEIAVIFAGGQSQTELLEKYRAIQRALRLEFE
ncbi:ATP-grasp domain-containing protein [Thiohalobacter thiocyanaticus]